MVVDVHAFGSWMSAPKCSFSRILSWMTPGCPRDIRPQNLLFGLMFRSWKPWLLEVKLSGSQYAVFPGLPSGKCEYRWQAPPGVHASHPCEPLGDCRSSGLGWHTRTGKSTAKKNLDATYHRHHRDEGLGQASASNSKGWTKKGLGSWWSRSGRSYEGIFAGRLTRILVAHKGWLAWSFRKHTQQPWEVMVCSDLSWPPKPKVVPEQ